MATRAALFIPNPDGASFTRIDVHYDGAPEHMFPALAAHDPSRILAAREIRRITPEEIEPFPSPRAPEVTCDARLPEVFDYAYLLDEGGWRRIRG